MPGGTRRSHTRTTASGRTVRVGEAKIAKGRGGTAAKPGSRTGRGRQNRDRAYAAAASAGSGAYFLLVHRQYVAATIFGLAALLFGSAYVIGRFRAAGKLSGRDRAKNAIRRNQRRRRVKATAARVWATLKPPEHRLMRRNEAAKSMRGSGWQQAGSRTPEKGAEPERRTVEPEPEQQTEPRRPRMASRRVHGTVTDTTTGKVVADSWLESYEVGCDAHERFDRDCPACLATVR